MSVASTDHLFFDRFRHRRRIEGVIVCVTALRIGTGRAHDGLATDLPILRDASGSPLIPGASIKGVLRSEVESLIRAVDEEMAPDPFAHKSKEPEEQGDAQQKAKRLHERLRESKDAVGAIFGRPSLASHVRFADAYPVRGSDPSIEVRDGVAIDRDLGRVSGSKKYDFEVVSAGSRFAFEVMMDGLEDHQEGAVIAGLELLNEGFARLGGFGSRGLGRVRLEELRVSGLVGPGLERFDQDWETFSEARIGAFRRWLASSQGDR